MDVERNFAEALEWLKSRAPAPPPPSALWLEDQRPSAQRSVLVLDGFNSDSRAHLSLFLSQPNLGVAVRPFSYAAEGRQYYWHHTWGSVLLHARRMAARYLPRARGQVIIPVGASGGGVAALLGSALWAMMRSDSWTAEDLAAAVPAVILIAPALSPPAELLTQYRAIYEAQAGMVPEIPIAIRQLCDPNDPLGRRTHSRIREGFAFLKAAGIRIFVVIWPPDALCPYPWVRDIQDAAESVIEPLLELNPRRLQAPSTETHAVVQHLRFLRDPETHNEIRQILAQC